MERPVTQEQRADFLIRWLLNERKEYKNIAIPVDLTEKRLLLRSLMNVRPPVPADEEFLAVQDAYLQERLAERGVTRIGDLSPVRSGIYLWQGDITTLAADAVVNAANSQMLGCFVPCHGCIDNAIHSAAGIQLRNECARIMEEEGREEKTGQARITAGYNLWRCYGDRPETAGGLLPLLSEPGGSLWAAQPGFLLYFHRRISFSEQAGSGNRHNDR